MSLIPATAVPFTGEAFTLDQSLRFEEGSTPYLTRTTTSTGSNYVATFSGWVKRVSTGTRHAIWSGWESSTERMSCYFLNDSLHMQIFSGGVAHDLETNAVFRDPSAWYHLVFQFNTSSGTESERFKMFVNGVQETSFSVDDTIGQNAEMMMWGSTSQYPFIGASKGNSLDNYFDGYMAEIHVIDGAVVAPSEFGETGDYGEWKPIEVEGLTYGTNGFYLSFAGGGIMAATGGTITTDGNYKVHSFTSNGTFTPTSISNAGEVEYLVIAGGGGGGSSRGGGGGAGGYRAGNLAVTEQAYSITVGAGGAAGTSGSSPYVGGSGVNSVFSAITAAGGGGGGAASSDTGIAGGSGGGAVGSSSPGAGNTPSTSPVQGYAGGTANSGSGPYDNWGAGGGGGSSGVGANGSATNESQAAGGAGTANDITGSSVTYAAGGAGGNQLGGSNGTPGPANTGNGGGGAENTAAGGGVDGAAGGSGIVIIRYKFQ